MSPLIIGAGNPNDKASIQLSTKKGTYIPNERKRERSPAALKAAQALWTGKFPNLKTRSLSATYNCVGLVFGCRRTCIDPEHLKMILQEDDYYRLEHESQVCIGDFILYVSNNEYSHIGIIVQKEPDIITGSNKILVLSQWGLDGEYLHSAKDVPQDYGNQWEFWTERKVLK